MSSVPAGLEIRGEKARPGQLPASRGRGLFATRSFAPGQEIAVFSKPLLVLPSGPDAATVCNYCLDPRRESVKLCTGCRVVAYCGPACQRAHWSRFHKVECKALQAAFASAAETAAAMPGAVVQPLPTPVRALMLLLLQWARSPDIRAAVDRLESNTHAFIANPQLWDDFKMQAAAACKFCSWFSEEQIKTAIEALCRIHTNAFDRFDPDLFLSGSFVDVTLAMANHACMPNAVVGFAGQAAYLRAQHPIAAGDEITISYIDWTKPRAERQKALRLYNFQCSCPRCRDDLDVYQAAQLSPVLALNTDWSSSQKFFSVVPSLDLLRNPPVLRDAAHNVTPQQVEAMYATTYELFRDATLENGNQLGAMRTLYATCQPLIKAKRWAVEPLAQLVRLALLYCIDVGNYAHLLVFASFNAQHVDPYQFPVPFASWRTKGLMNIAKAIPHAMMLVMADIPLPQAAQAAREARSLGGPRADPRRVVDPRVLEVLESMTDGCLFAALLTMIMHNGPLGHSERWSPLDNARVLLAGFQAEPQHEAMKELIDDWYNDPSDPEMVEVFDELILEPLNRLSALAPDLLEKLVKQ
ncbi:hypothetical protein SCUCBS95973_002075 [Sporothrix curviconia]|uniref:Suppressor of anucleate metulae protein B n=1 Tax=Sporothrix curviconia TaxID=1260050 RepID=A0ABP0B417_9PEZI